MVIEVDDDVPPKRPAHEAERDLYRAVLEYLEDTQAPVPQSRWHAGEFEYIRVSQSISGIANLIVRY